MKHFDHIVSVSQGRPRDRGLHSRGEDFGRKVGDVGRDGVARQKLSHLVGEGVAVVLKQTIPVTSEPREEWKGES